MKMDRLLRCSEVEAMTGLSHRSIYRKMHDGTFPVGRKVGVKAIRWSLAEVTHWLSTRPLAGRHPSERIARRRLATKRALPCKIGSAPVLLGRRCRSSSKGILALSSMTPNRGALDETYSGPISTAAA